MNKRQIQRGNANLLRLAAILDKVPGSDSRKAAQFIREFVAEREAQS